jgi:fatty-acyl-CoA synthase
MFNQYLTALDQADYNVSSLQTGVMAGSVCPEPLIQKVYSRLNMHGLCVVYGMTELSPVATMMGPSAPVVKKTTTVGHPGPGTEVKIVCEKNNLVPVGEKGELHIKGYLTMMGYWNDQEKTSETLEHGWMKSGDLGVMDADGYV